MTEWMQTVTDALIEARDADDPCCGSCTRKALTLLADEVERLRAIETRLRDAALNEAGPRGRWAAEMIAIRSGEG